ncbi:PAS domain S-box protein [Sulfurimonas sp. HSL-1716]|uniref:PAS domain S-box protein n=1 Tax=Hydrocurvibacter sulfurireducens TaxID=3131937 RepID=UPI0031F87934
MIVTDDNSKLDILIIDNEEVDIHAVVDLLQDEYSVRAAGDSLSVMKMIKQKRPDIILFDTNIPYTDAHDIIKRIHDDELNKEIPIILLSGHSIDHITKWSDLGVADYISKPIEPKSFMLKLSLWAKLVKKTMENKEKQQLLEQYKNIVDRSAVVSKTDKRGIITYANDKFCEISGYTQEELIGKPHNIIRHPDMPTSAFENLWGTIKAGRPWVGKVKNLKKNGGYYYVDTIVNPVLDDHGNVIEYIALRYDITELEQYKDLLKDELSTTSRNLEENMNYMRQYEEAISFVTAILKTDTNNIITYANARFCELMGYQIQDLIGQDCSQLRDEKHRLMLDCENIKEEVKNKKTVTKLLTNITKDGRKLHMTTFFYPIVDRHSNVTEYLQIMHDVTEIVNLNEEIIDTQKEVILTMGTIGETRSKETGLHVKRVAEYSYILAKLAGLSEKQASTIKQASPMHDIGKIGIPESILNKPGKLTKEEFEIVKTHSTIGYEMLKYSKRNILKTAATIAYSHHERYDGNGYPNNLAGEDIPIEGRLTAIADVFDALGTDRVYKKAWKLEKIIDFLKEEKSKHFDPVLVDIFLNNIEKFLLIRDTYRDVEQESALTSK